MATDMLLLVQATSDEENPHLTLQHENIQRIIRMAKDRPLSILSIVGPQKTGKSLLLSFMIKYLIAAENDDIDWIDWKAKTKPLEEVKWPEAGQSSRSTAGIWCFNHPFIIKLDECEEKNKEVAVILLYAQSSHVCKWTEDKLTSALFGLTIAASSCTIFNVSKQVDEKFLGATSSFIQHAMLTVKKQEGKQNEPPPPFQDAMILVRDWSYPSEYAYGVSGGIKYLKSEKLREKVVQSKDARINRQIFSSIFENISGCLLPYPGNDAIKPNFKGSLAEMETQFVEQLKGFITEYVDLERLTIKKNEMKEVIGADDWKQILESCIELINCTEVESKNRGAVILEQLGLRRNVLPGEEREHIKMALRLYGKAFAKLSRNHSSPILSDAALNEFHSKASKVAGKALKKEMISADVENDDDIETMKRNHRAAERLLKEKLQEKLNANMMERDKLKEKFIEECNQELVGLYSESMKNAFSSKKSAPSETEAKKISKLCTDDVKKRFLYKIGEQNEGGRMSESNQTALAIFSEKLKQAEARMLETILNRNDSSRNVNFEGESIKKLNINNDMTNSKLHTNFDKPISSTEYTHSKAFSLPETTKITNETLIKKPLREKEAQIESTGQKKNREQRRVESEKLIEEANHLLTRLKNKYVSYMDKQLESGGDLEKCHDKEFPKLVQDFENQCPFQSDSQDFRLYKSILEDDLKLAFTSAKSKSKLLKRKKQANVVKVIQNACKAFEENFEKYLSSNGDVESKALQEQSAILMHDELSVLKKTLSEGEFTKARQEAEEDMKMIYEKLKSKHERKRNITAQSSKRLINDCKSEYNEHMNQIMTKLSDLKSLEREHTNVKNIILEKFKKQARQKTQDHTLLDGQLQELEDEILTAFSNFKRLFEMKLKGEKGTAKLAVSRARLFYKEEMDRHFKNHEFILDANLHKLHTKVSTEAVKMCLPDADKKQLEELRESLEEMFKMYKDENDMNINEEPAIGIDLGTTFSCVSIYISGQVKIIPNSVGKLTTPSYVLFQPNGEEIVGVEAKERAYENPEGTIFDAKRILGRRLYDEKLQEDMKLWPFTIVDGGHGIPMIEVNGKRYNPEMISAKILAQLKKDAELYLKRPVSKAVITVPAYFTDGQKQATVDAGKMAGLEVLSILNEPVAAAMAYKLQYSSGQLEADKDRHILIFDLGGGTFDVAVLRTSKGNIEVLTVDGDTHLGGEDFDKNLMEYCAAEFKKINKVDLFEGKDSSNKKVKDDVRRTLKRLQAECERQKIALASGISAEVALDGIYKNMDLRVSISRATFEKINAGLFETTIKVVEKALKAAKLDKSEIDDVVLVGGSTRIPKIQRMLKDFFNGKELDKKINPDEAVAHGAGLLAAIKKGNINKDSAAFTRIQDITPMPIGVEVYGGAFSIIIPKSTKIPVKCEEKYRTAHNNQTSVQITIYEGEDKVAVNNKHLGDFYLNGIPPKDAGMENIDVEMLINDQGILHVTASVSSTGSKTAVTVTENKQRMGQAAIKRYIAEKLN